MNFITKPLSNTNVYSDKLQIVIMGDLFTQYVENGPNLLYHYWFIIIIIT